MNRKEERKTIRDFAVYGLTIFTKHADERLHERGISHYDVLKGIYNPKAIFNHRYQKNSESINVVSTYVKQGKQRMPMDIVISLVNTALGGKKVKIITAYYVR